MSLSSRSIRSKSSALLNTTTNLPPIGSINSTTPVHQEDDLSLWTLDHQPNPTTPPQTNPVPPTTTNTTVESLLTLAQKRITTLIYLKKVHEGKVHWFNTILLSRSELEKWFDHGRMVNRTTKFAILGMSLSSVLDITNLQDFLKAMMNLLHELETIPSDNYKPKISNLSRGIFKQNKSSRKSAGGADYSITLQDSGDPSFLYTPNIPFDLDYFEVWVTLSDILVEVYQKMINFITASGGVSGLSSSTSGKPTTLGASSGANGVPGLGTTTNSVSNTPLMGASIAVPIPPTRSSSSYSILTLSQPAVSHHHLESIARIDSKLKKLIVILTKEIDGMARTAIREELAQLDPMLSTTFGLNELHQAGDWD